MFQQTPLRRVLIASTRIKAFMVWFVALCLLAASLLGGFLLPIQQANAATTSTLNFQARLESSTGAIVPDGLYNVEFKLYTASAVDGGETPIAGSCTTNPGAAADEDCVWTERYYDSDGGGGNPDNRVSVQNGYLTVNLGSQTAFGSTINWDQDLWIAMNIGGATHTSSPTWDGEMSPRMRLTGVPYAFRAGMLATAHTSNGFTSTLAILQPTVGNQTFQVPDMAAAGTYTICVQTAGCTAGSGSAFYIQNQQAAQQTTSNFWISGTGRADTSLQAPLIDTATAVALDIGTTNATVINLNEDTTVAAGKNIRLIGGLFATRPASPAAGMLYYDTTSNQFLTYNGSKWMVGRDVNTKIVAASNSTQSAKDIADYVADGEAIAGPGTVDGDQVQINQALDAVETGAIGGTVYLMEGTYTADATIRIPNNVTLAGQGRSTNIQLTDTNGGSDNLIENKDVTTGTGVEIKDLRIDGRSDYNTSGNQWGIVFDDLGSGTGSSSVPGGKITNVTMSNFRQYGISLTSSSGIFVTNSVFDGNGIGGIWALDAEYSTFNDNLFQGNTNFAIGLLGTSAHNQVTGNVMESHNQSIDLNTGTANNIISNNRIIGGSLYGISLNGSTNNTIIGNNISTTTNDAGWGIRLTTSANNNIITGNRIHDTAGATNTNAIYVTASDNNSITSNDITDSSCSTTCYAINFFDSTSDTNYVSGNRIASTMSINDLGTGTIYGNQMNGSGVLMDRSPSVSLQSTTNGQDLFLASTVTTTNLLTNPGFDSVTTGWAVTTGTGASGARTTTAANVYGGTGAYAVTLATSASTTTTQIQAAGLSGGSLATNTYTMSFWAKGSGAITLAAVLFDGSDACTLSSTSVTTSWQRFTCTTGALGTTTTSINITTTTLSQTLYIDNVQLQTGSTATAYNIGSLQLQGIITSSILQRNTYDSTATFQIQNAAGNEILTVDTSSGSVKLGKASSVTGSLVFQNSTNANTVTINSGVTSGNYSLTLPTALGASGDCLKDTNGSGVLGFSSCGGGSGANVATLLVGTSASGGASGAVASQSTTGADSVNASTTSAQTVINTALSTVGAAGGGSVFLMEGTYIIDGSIVIPSNTMLIGTGAGTVIKFKNAINADFQGIINSDTTTGNVRITVKDLRIDGNKANQSSGTQRGIYFVKAGTGSGLASNATAGALIHNIWVHDVYGGSGIYMDDSNNIAISDSHIWNGGDNGIFLDDVDGFTITGNRIQQNTESGIYSFTSSTAGTITGNMVEGNGDHGIYLQSSSFVTVSGNNSTGNGGSGVYVANNSADNVITGNSIHNNTSDGIFLTNNAARTSVTANKITDTAGATVAINIAVSTVTNTYLADNTYSGTGAASIDDDGTGTIYANQIDSTGVLQSKSSAGHYFQTSTNSATGFQVQNATSQSLFQVDTVNTTNLITNSGFDTNVTGYGNVGTGTTTRTTTAANVFGGIGALQVTLGGSANSGTQVQSGAISGGTQAAGTYSLSFYAKGSASLTGLAVSFSGGGTCTLSTTTVSSSGYQRYTCTVTTVGATTSINITAATTSQTLYIDAIQLQTGSAATAYNAGSLHLLGLVRSPVVLQNSSDSTNSFAVLNAAGYGLLNVNTLDGQVALGTGSALAGTLVFRNASNGNAVTITSGTTSTAYALTLPVAGATGAQCAKSTSGSTSSATALEWGSCGGGTSSLQGAYDGTAGATPSILLSNTYGGILIRDASSSSITNLFTIQNNAATANYLNLTSTEFKLQDAGGRDALAFDSATMHLKIFEDVASSPRYADIYYNSGSSEAVFAASSGTTRIGAGSGDVTMTLTNSSDEFTYSKTVTLGGAYSGNDFVIGRAITAGAHSLTGAVLKVESTSGGSGTRASDILMLHSGTGDTGGNLIIATAGSGGAERFKVDKSGNVVLAGGAGSGSVLMSSGSGVAMNITSNGASTWQTSTGNLTLQSTDADSRLVFNATDDRLEIGESDDTGTLLVLDTKTGTSDPTGTDGAMYYNSGLDKFRCYQNGGWGNCLPAAASFTDTTTESMTDANVDLWDGTIPNLDITSTGKILVSVNIVLLSDGADDEVDAFTIRRAVGSNPTCSSTTVGIVFSVASTNAGESLTANLNIVDTPGSAGNARYIICSDTASSGTVSNDTTYINVVLQEIGG